MFNGMFDNIGSKIKGLAELVTKIGIVLACIIGLLLIFVADSVLAGLIVIVLGSLISWLGSLTLYAFGQLVEDIEKIRKEVEKQSADSYNFYNAYASSAYASTNAYQTANYEQQTPMNITEDDLQKSDELINQMFE